jgi:hypothetical protein
MALSAQDKVEIRQECARVLSPVTWSKSDINDALDAIEAWFDLPAVQSDLSAKIDAGTTFSFTAPQKKQLVKFWLRNRFGRE